MNCIRGKGNPVSTDFKVGEQELGGRVEEYELFSWLKWMIERIIRT